MERMDILQEWNMNTGSAWQHLNRILYQLEVDTELGKSQASRREIIPSPWEEEGLRGCGPVPDTTSI